MTPHQKERKVTKEDVETYLMACGSGPGWTNEAMAKVCRSWLQMRELVEEFLAHEGVPRHTHQKPGIWDDDNGDLAGQPCQWCAFLVRARATLKPEKKRRKK